MIKTAPKREMDDRAGEVVHWAVEFRSKLKFNQSIRQTVHRTIEVISKREVSD